VKHHRRGKRASALLHLGRRGFHKHTGRGRNLWQRQQDNYGHTPPSLVIGSRRWLSGRPYNKALSPSPGCSAPSGGSPHLLVDRHPEPIHELGNPVGYYILWETIKAKDLGEHDLCSLFGSGELGQGNKVSHIGEPVNNGENDRITFGHGQAGDEVQGDVGPRPLRHWKMVSEPRWTPTGGLILGAYLTGGTCPPPVMATRTAAWGSWLAALPLGGSVVWRNVPTAGLPRARTGGRGHPVSRS